MTALFLRLEEREREREEKVRGEREKERERERERERESVVVPREKVRRERRRERMLHCSAAGGAKSSRPCPKVPFWRIVATFGAPCTTRRHVQVQRHRARESLQVCLKE